VGTPTLGGCESTASPSAIAEVCGYPTPDDDCFYSCAASSGAADCLSQCADDNCAYAVFKVGSEGGSPYASGTCWKYPNGTYDASKAGRCSGSPEQFVYNNTCPRAPVSSPSSSSVSESGAKPIPTTVSTKNATAEEVTKVKTSGSERATAKSVVLSASLTVGISFLIWWSL
jgi:hypothetical protein